MRAGGSGPAALLVVGLNSTTQIKSRRFKCTQEKERAATAITHLGWYLTQLTMYISKDSQQWLQNTGNHWSGSSYNKKWGKAASYRITRNGNVRRFIKHGRTKGGKNVLPAEVVIIMIAKMSQHCWLCLGGWLGHTEKKSLGHGPYLASWEHNAHRGAIVFAWRSQSSGKSCESAGIKTRPSYWCRQHIGNTTILCARVPIFFAVFCAVSPTETQFDDPSDDLPRTPTLGIQHNNSARRVEQPIHL